MSSSATSGANLIDKIVNNLAEALVTDPGFRSLCHAALKRKSRSTVLQHISQAFITFSKHVSRQNANDLQKATAWMMYECRTSIALRICELISPEEQSLNILLSSLGQDYVSVSNQERILSFINQNFKVSEQFFTGAVRLLNPRDEDDELGSSPQGESDHDQELPDLEVFKNEVEYKSFVRTGIAFQEMHKKLRSTLFPPPSQMINGVLRKHLLKDPYESHLRSVACVVEWQLLEYFKTEHVAVADLDSIFTISGDLECAGAARLEDYMCGRWTSGRETLNVIKTLLGKLATEDKSTGIQNEHSTGKSKSRQEFLSAATANLEMQLFPASVSSQEQAYVKISGTFEEIQERLEQLAWLAATLRSRVEGQLTVSCIDFRIIPTTSSSLTEPDIFHLSLLSHNQVFEPANTAPGQCWTTVVSESVLAYGYSVPGQSRPKDAIGLEAPFDIVASFAGIRYPVFIKERIVFASSSCVLIPERKVGDDAIQWHFERSDNWIDEVIPKRADTWDTRLETINVSSLTHSRGFLGYCSISEEVIGTSEFEHVDTLESEVPRISKIALPSTEDLFRVFVDAHGQAVSGDGTRWRFNQGETALIRAFNQDPDERLRCTARNPILLYDQASLTAFLVSELGVVMHLVTTHLREKSQLKRQRIPLAPISADGGEAAYKAIHQSKELVINFADAPSRQYIDVVEMFLDILEQRKLQQHARMRFDKSVASSKGIRGWDHADIQTLKHEIWERELQPELTIASPTWWQLFRSTKSLVLFTRLSKCPIRKSETNSRSNEYNCKAWDQIPQGQHMFVANVMQLQILRSRICENPRSFATRYMLGDNVAWARPTHSRLFESTCRDGGSCSPLQAMVVLGSESDAHQNQPKGWKDEAMYHHHPGPMMPLGVVIFADEPNKFEKRRCWRKAQSPMHHPSEWNYPYLGVSFLVIILAWWNFRLIAVSLVLLGVAYILK